MYSKRNMIWYVCTSVVGFILIILGCLEIVDSFWSGMGGGLAAVGILKILRSTAARKNPEYAQRFDTNSTDERNIYLSNKAKSWAFYLTILGLAIAGIVFKIAGLEAVAMTCFIVMCVMTCIYWIAYLILNKLN